MYSITFIENSFVELNLIENLRKKKDGCSSIGRTTVCGTVSSLFDSGILPLLNIYIVDRYMDLSPIKLQEKLGLFIQNLFFRY